MKLMENTSFEKLHRSNKRVGRLKERIFRWDINQIVYTCEKNNTTADAFTRRPVVTTIILASTKVALTIE